MEARFWRGHLTALAPARVTRDLSLVFRIAILRPKEDVGIFEKTISTEKIKTLHHSEVEDKKG
jgi:hypothetical protein